MQQVNTFKEHLSLLMRRASYVNEELGILRNQLKKEASAKAGSQTDLIPHKVNASIQTYGPETFVWYGTGVVSKNVTKMIIADGVTSIGYGVFKNCWVRNITMPIRFKNLEKN